MIKHEKTVAVAKSLLNIYPSLTLDNIIEDLEYELEALGVSVKYADLNSLERTESKLHNEKIIVGGYARVNRKGIPTIVINGNHSSLKRRGSMAVLFAIILLEWNWFPHKGKADRELASVYLEGEDNIGGYAIQLASNLLLPLEEVIETMDSLSFMKNNRVKMSLATDLISKVYKVPDYIVKKQINKYIQLREHSNDK